MSTLSGTPGYIDLSQWQFRKCVLDLPAECGVINRSVGPGAMRSVVRTLLGVLLLVSLTAAPVASVVASVLPVGHMSDAGGGAVVACAHTAKGRTPGISQRVSTSKDSCTCCVEDCSSMDKGSCQHSATSSPAVLMAGAVKLPVTGTDRLKAADQDRHTGLNVPPDSPPPIT